MVNKSLFLAAALVLAINAHAQCTYFIKVKSHGSSSYGIKNDGTLWAWGQNNYGQLGDGSSADRLKPVQIGTSTNWADVEPGERFALGLTKDGKLYSWGWNAFGQLGQGNTTSQNTPVQIGTSNNWKSISAGGGHAVARMKNGTLWTWGYNSFGQVGDSTINNRLAPYQIGIDTGWVSADAGFNFTVAIDDEGKLYSWGKGTEGQLGNGDIQSRKFPTRIGASNYWLEVKAGYAHSIAKSYDNKLWAWGVNNKGQIGDNTILNRTTPVLISNETNWTAFYLGYSFSAGIKNDGKIYLWGDNTFGQLGDGTVNSKLIPTKLNNPNTWVELAIGSSHTIAVAKDGKTWTWGNNDKGQLGDSTTITKVNPAAITTAPLTVISNQPKPQVICGKSNATFNVTASGYGMLNYAWYKNNTLVGLNSSQLVVYNASSSDTGWYKVEINSNCEKVTSDSVRLTLANTTSFTSQPTGATGCSGISVNLNATAVGTGVITYQWYKNGVFTGSVGKNFYINSLATKDVGFYKLLAKGDCGETFSDSVKVSVIPNILITNQLTPDILAYPSNKISYVIQATEFSTPNIYQWKKDGKNILNNTKYSGANTAKLDINNIDSNDAGIYTVDVQGACNSMSSNNATLRVYKKVTNPGGPTSGIQENNSSNLSLYPNPSIEFLNIQLEKSVASYASIELINASGNILYSERIMPNQSANIQVDISSFAVGMYFARITIDGQVSTQSFVVAK